jgi:hypothetical protein
MKQNKTVFNPGYEEYPVPQRTQLPNIVFIVNLLDKRFSCSGSFSLKNFDIVLYLSEINPAVLPFLL